MLQVSLSEIIAHNIVETKTAVVNKEPVFFSVIGISFKALCFCTASGFGFLLFVFQSF